MGETAAPSPAIKSNPTPPKAAITPLPPPPRSFSRSSRAKVSHLFAVFSYLLSLPLLIMGIWLLYTRDYSCEDLLHMTHLRAYAGIGLLVLFAITNFVVYHGEKVLMPGMLVMSVLMAGMMMMGFALIGSYKIESRAVPASPMWIKLRLANNETWTNVKNCLSESQMCSELAYQTIGIPANDFNTKHLSSIESGCCMPPNLCKMEYVNATYWKRIPDKVAAHNVTATVNPNTYGDCQAWSNEITQLCYDCRSCKQAYLSTVHGRWKSVGLFFIVMSVFLIVAHGLRFIVTMCVTK